MKLKHSIFAIIASLAIIASVQNVHARTYAEHSVLASGTWVKIRVSETGICKLTYDQIKEMGFKYSVINTMVKFIAVGTRQ